MSEPTALLGDLVSFVRAGAWGSDEMRRGFQRVRVVRNGDAARSPVIEPLALPSRWMSSKETSAATIALGDSVLVSSGDVGRVTRLAAASSETVVASNFVRIVRPARSIDDRWFFHVLSSDLAQRAARLASGGTTIENLSWKSLQKWRLYCPDPEQQRLVADVLDAVDADLRCSARLIAKLRLVKDGLLDDLLTRGLDAHGHLREGVAVDAFQNSSLGRVPDDWDVLSIEELIAAPVCYGIVQAGRYVEGGPLVVTIGDLHGDFATGLHRAAPFVEHQYARSRIRGGDVLLSIKGTIGRTAVVPETFEGNISRDVARLRFGSLVIPEFAEYYLSSRLGQRRLVRAVVGSTRAEISIHVLKRFFLPVPRLPEQEAIVGRVEAVDAKLRVEVRRHEKLQLVKRAASADLLTGHVRPAGGAA